MNTRTKTVGLLTGTLLIGIVLGAFMHSLFIRHTVKRMSHKWRKPDFFIEHFEEMLQPTADQKDEIDNILKKHHEEMMNLRRRMPVLFDSLRSDLNAVLNEKQQKTLNDHFNKMTKKNRTRPPHRPPDHDLKNRTPRDESHSHQKKPV